MKNTLLALLPLVLGLSLAQGQAPDRPTQGLTLGYFNDKFGSHGFRAGYELPIWQQFRPENEGAGLKHALIIKANINFYQHKRHHNGLSVNLSIGYRYSAKSGLIVEPLHLGTGYLHSFLAGKTYELNAQGELQRVRSAGNASFILPYIQLLGLGYDFRQKTKLPLSFMVSLDPYVQHRVNTQAKLRLATPITLTYFLNK